jgi:hypothetical protein
MGHFFFFRCFLNVLVCSVWLLRKMYQRKRELGSWSLGSEFLSFFFYLYFIIFYFFFDNQTYD